MFAYSNKTHILIWDTKVNSLMAYYKYRHQFIIDGFISSNGKTDIDIELPAPLFGFDKLRKLNGEKVLLLGNNIKMVAQNLKNIGLKFYKDFIPDWLFEYTTIKYVDIYQEFGREAIENNLQKLLHNKTGVIVNGNCQIAAIKKYLMANDRFNEKYCILDIPPIFSQTEISVKAIKEKFFYDSIGLVLTQSISDTNAHCAELSTGELRKQVSKTCKFFVIPNFWFTGYFSQHKKNEFNVLEKELTNGVFTWGDRYLDELAQHNYGSKTIISAVSDINFISKEKVLFNINEQIKAFKAREDGIDTAAKVDIPIGDYIEANCKREILFYSANHPKNCVIKECVNRILKAVGLYYQYETPHYINEKELDETPILKSSTECVYPSVFAHLGIDDRNYTYCPHTYLQDDEWSNMTFDECVDKYLSYCHNIASTLESDNNYLYPQNTSIFIYGTDDASRIAYYKYRHHFNVKGFISGNAEEKCCDKEVFTLKGALRKLNTKILIPQYNEQIKNRLIEEKLKPIIDFCPEWAFEYKNINACELYKLVNTDDFGKALKFMLKNKKGVFLNGNCQINPIEEYLYANKEFRDNYIVVKLPPIFQHNEISRKILTSESFFENIDLILTQNISKANLHCYDGATEVIESRKKKTCKLITIANLWFTGYFPQHVKNEYNVLVKDMPNGAFIWGDKYLDEVAKTDMSSKLIEKIIFENDFINKEKIENNFRIQFLNIEEREKLVDVKMLDYIKANYNKRILFHSANHPDNLTIKELVTRILLAIGMFANRNEIKFEKDNLKDGKEYLRAITEYVYPAVYNYLGLNFEADKQYSPSGLPMFEFNNFIQCVKSYLSFCHNIDVG